eukprot:m51a1_g9910 putative zinc finger (1720) ;mRNA; f:103451-112369
MHALHFALCQSAPATPASPGAAEAQVRVQEAQSPGWALPPGGPGALLTTPPSVCRDPHALSVLSRHRLLLARQLLAALSPAPSPLAALCSLPPAVQPTRGRPGEVRAQGPAWRVWPAAEADARWRGTLGGRRGAEMGVALRLGGGREVRWRQASGGPWEAAAAYYVDAGRGLAACFTLLLGCFPPAPAELKAHSAATLSCLWLGEEAARCMRGPGGRPRLATLQMVPPATPASPGAAEAQVRVQEAQSPGWALPPGGPGALLTTPPSVCRDPHALSVLSRHRLLLARQLLAALSPAPSPLAALCSLPPAVQPTRGRPGEVRAQGPAWRVWPAAEADARWRGTLGGRRGAEMGVALRLGGGREVRWRQASGGPWEAAAAYYVDAGRGLAACFTLLLGCFPPAPAELKAHSAATLSCLWLGEEAARCMRGPGGRPRLATLQMVVNSRRSSDTDLLLASIRPHCPADLDDDARALPALLLPAATAGAALACDRALLDELHRLQEGFAARCDEFVRTGRPSCSEHALDPLGAAQPPPAHPLRAAPAAEARLRVARTSPASGAPQVRRLEAAWQRAGLGFLFAGYCAELLRARHPAGDYEVAYDAHTSTVSALCAAGSERQTSDELDRLADSKVAEMRAAEVEVSVADSAASAVLTSGLEVAGLSQTPSGRTARLQGVRAASRDEFAALLRSAGLGSGDCEWTWFDAASHRAVVVACSPEACARLVEYARGHGMEARSGPAATETWGRQLRVDSTALGAVLQRHPQAAVSRSQSVVTTCTGLPPGLTEDGVLQQLVPRPQGLCLRSGELVVEYAAEEQKQGALSLSKYLATVPKGPKAKISVRDASEVFVTLQSPVDAAACCELHAGKCEGVAYVDVPAIELFDMRTMWAAKYGVRATQRRSDVECVVVELAGSQVGLGWVMRRIGSYGDKLKKRLRLLPVAAQCAAQFVRGTRLKGDVILEQLCARYRGRAYAEYVPALQSISVRGLHTEAELDDVLAELRACMRSAGFAEGAPIPCVYCGDTGADHAFLICGHRYCLRCLKSSLDAAALPARCPSCSQAVAARELANVVAPHELARAASRALRAHLAARPCAYVAPCPHAGCSGVVAAALGYTRCAACKSSVCGRCAVEGDEEHATRTCEQFQEYRADCARCPVASCGATLSRKAGYHACKGCGLQVCAACGAVSQKLHEGRSCTAYQDLARTAYACPREGCRGELAKAAGYQACGECGGMSCGCCGIARDDDHAGIPCAEYVQRLMTRLVCCPAVGCRGRVDKRQGYHRCPTCAAWVCGSCRALDAPAHSGRTCAEFAQVLRGMYAACPSPGCRALVEKKVAKCGACGALVCGACAQSNVAGHEGVSCAEYKQRADWAAFADAAFARAERWARDHWSSEIGRITRIDRNAAIRDLRCPAVAKFLAGVPAARDSLASMVMCWHGSAEYAIAAICSSGWNVALRRGQVHGAGEYFGVTAAISHGYCKGSSRMIVALVAQGPWLKLVPSFCYVVANAADGASCYNLPVCVVSYGAQASEPLCIRSLASSAASGGVLGLGGSQPAAASSWRCPFEWSWRNDSGAMEPFGAQDNAEIERLYCRHRAQPTGALGSLYRVQLRRNNDNAIRNYQVDFASMEQVNCATGYRRPLGRALRAVAPAPSSGAACWSFREAADTWLPYDSQSTRDAEALFQKYLAGGQGTATVAMRGRQYELDFICGQQRNLITGVARPIKRC